MSTPSPLISARGLTVRFGSVQALNGVDLDILRGETLALVGESGSGKSTLGRALLRTIPAQAERIQFDGVDLLTLGGRDLRRFRRRFQMVFQDPFGSLNPRLSIGSAIAEPLSVHGLARGEALKARVAECLRGVGLDPAMASRRPHAFSGGQRQRICIARAIAAEPEFIVADEALSALDVSLQKQVLALFKDLKDRLSLTYLFISHDLAVVRQIADRVAVMYLGGIVELAPVDALYRSPRHPYTQALLAAAPRPDPAGERARPEAPLRGPPAAPGCRDGAGYDRGRRPAPTRRCRRGTSPQPCPRSGAPRPGRGR